MYASKNLKDRISKLFSWNWNRNCSSLTVPEVHTLLIYLFIYSSKSVLYVLS